MNCLCANGGRQEKPTPSHPRVEEIVEKYLGKPGSLIPILQEVQNQLGYLPRSDLKYIAYRTGIRPAQIYGVVTFYTQFRLEPMGRYLIMVCQGTACHVNGADTILQALEDELGVATGGTTPDAIFTLETVACLGCCSLAPVMMVNGQTYGKLTPAKARKIIADYRKKAAEQTAASE